MTKPKKHTHPVYELALRRSGCALSYSDQSAVEEAVFCPETSAALGFFPGGEQIVGFDNGRSSAAFLVDRRDFHLQCSVIADLFAFQATIAS
jgi:hypothetical protein